MPDENISESLLVDTETTLGQDSGKRVQYTAHLTSCLLTVRTPNTWPYTVNVISLKVICVGFSCYGIDNL